MSTVGDKLEKFADRFLPSDVDFSTLKTERLWVLLIFAAAFFSILFLLVDLIVVVGPATYYISSLALMTPIYLWLFRTGYTGASKLFLHIHAILVLFCITLQYTDAGFAWTFIIPTLMSSEIIFTEGQRWYKLLVQVCIFAFIPSYLLCSQFIAPLSFDATSMYVFKIVNLSGSLGFCVLILNTLTQLNNKAQAQLRIQADENDKQNKMMLGSIRTRDKLLSMMSHDLRGDIAKTIGVVDVIEQAQLSSENQSKLLGSLKEDASKTLETLENMLQWTRAQQDELNVNRQPCDVMEILAQLKCNHEFALSIKRIHVNLDVTVKHMVSADRNMMDCILRNLLGNAIKFTPVGKTITISARSVGERIEFAVHDSGIGMSAEQVDNITRGVQFTTLGTNREKGRGVGMMLVSEFLAKHDAVLCVDSKPGEGTTFSFSLESHQLS